MKTLIVEDHAVNRVVLSRMLSEIGDIDTAENGDHALQKVQRQIDLKEPYGLICLDIMMPKLDGKKALKQIRAMEFGAGIEGTNRAKIVMTTALDAATDIMTAFKDECDGYLVKPISTGKLQKTFRELGIETPASWNNNSESDLGNS